MTFAEVLDNMPLEYRGEIVETDACLKAMRPLRFKRVLDKNGSKITYVASDCGVSYMFKMADGAFKHNFQWYIVYNGKPDTWHRRADFMEATLAYIAKSDYPLSARVFDALKRCPGGGACYGERCLARTVYAFDGQRRLACHGSVEPGLDKGGFSDARAFFRYLNDYIAAMATRGDPPPERILVYKTRRAL